MNLYEFPEGGGILYNMHNGYEVGYQRLDFIKLFFDVKFYSLGLHEINHYCGSKHHEMIRYFRHSIKMEPKSLISLELKWMIADASFE